MNFKNGGVQPIKQNEYIHVAPDKGYDKQYSMNFTGIGSVTGVHNKRLFFKVNRRYGVLDLEITPSRSLFIEYLLSKDSDKKELNIPSYSGDHGEEYDYFSCAGVPYKWTEIQKTPAGSCAKLGGTKCL